MLLSADLEVSQTAALWLLYDACQADTQIVSVQVTYFRMANVASLWWGVSYDIIISNEQKSFMASILAIYSQIL